MARICCSSCLDCKMYSVKRKLILARFTTLSLTADDLPDQTLRQRRRTRGAWPDQTGPTAAEESGWWTAARARTEPAHQHDTHWGAADLLSKMQIYSLFLLGNYWKEMKCLITTITLRMISTGEGTEDKLKHVCESITYSNQETETFQYLFCLWELIWESSFTSRTSSGIKFHLVTFWGGSALPRTIQQTHFIFFTGKKGW